MADATDDLIARIYEAAFVPEMWPQILESLSDLSESFGGALLATNSSRPPRWIATDSVAERLHAFASGDAWRHNQRPQRWLAHGPGFWRDIDVFPEMLGAPATEPHLRTYGLGWQLGAVMPMPGSDVVVFSMERHGPDGPHSEDNRDGLEPFRPHLSRAGLLAARLGLERAQTSVVTLEAVGMPAAVLDRGGRVLAANTLLGAMPGVFLPAAFGRLALTDPEADVLLQEAVAAPLPRAEPGVHSIPVRRREGQSPFVIHILPLLHSARDIFWSAELLVVATTVSTTAAVPSLPLLRDLFDLTPAEARLAAALVAGRPLKDAAADQGIKFSTARSYVERVLQKTGTRQQSELVALLKSAHAFPLSPEP